MMKIGWVYLVFQERKNVTKTPPVGLEPTTFELEVQHASPLRHGGFTRTLQKIAALLFCSDVLVTGAERLTIINLVLEKTLLSMIFLQTIIPSGKNEFLLGFTRRVVVLLI